MDTHRPNDSRDWLVTADAYQVRQLRLAKGWTQAKLAALARCSKRNVERIESGGQAGMRVQASTLLDLANALGVPIEALVLRPGQPEPAVAPEPAVPIGAPAEAVSVEVAEATWASPSLPPPHRARGRFVLAAAAVIVAVLALTYGYVARPLLTFLDGQPRAPQMPASPSLVILPFQTIGSGVDEDIADGLTYSLNSRLSQVPSYFVIASSSAFTYKHQQVKLTDIGRDLGVRYVVQGTLESDGEHFRVRVELADTQTGFNRWSREFNIARDERMRLESEIAESIAIATRVQIDESELARISRKPTSQGGAYEAFVQGVVEVNRCTRHGIGEAQRLFRRAIELDPNYAEAYALLGAAYSLEYINHWSRDPKQLAIAEQLATRALSLDSILPQAYATLANIYVFRGQTEKAIELARKAVDLYPNGEWPHAILGMALAQNGKLLGALEEMNQALRLDPRSPTTLLVAVSFVKILAGQAEDAMSLLEGVREGNPDLIPPRLMLAAMYEKRGRHEEAVSAAREILALRPDFTIEEAMEMFPRLHHLIGVDLTTATQERWQRTGLPHAVHTPTA